MVQDNGYHCCYCSKTENGWSSSFLAWTLQGSILILPATSMQLIVVWKSLEIIFSSRLFKIIFKFLLILHCKNQKQHSKEEEFAKLKPGVKKQWKTVTRGWESLFYKRTGNEEKRCTFFSISWGVQKARNFD